MISKGILSAPEGFKIQENLEAFEEPEKES
jgi:hypothetical protein